MAYDSGRDTLYITSGESVLRYQLGTNFFLTPFNLGGSLAGLDLSPDGNTLVVADRTRTEANVWVHVIDLRTGATSKALFPRAFGEGGTFIYNSNLVKTATLGQYAGAEPIGVVYHPVEDTVYFPWATR